MSVLPETDSVEVFRSRKKKPCLERALVLQAQGIPHAIQPSAEGFHLFVRGELAAAALTELEHYDRENKGWPPRYEIPRIRSRGAIGAALYALTLIAVYPFGRHGVLGIDAWTAGKMHAGRVTDGEWWRTLTSLTLHGDASHLAGNVLFGCAYGVLLSHTLGAGLTWLAVVLAGGLGNLANALLQRPDHTAIGASTAVFGALGVLVAYEWMRRGVLHHPPMRRLAPILGGAVIFGFYGGWEGPRTDVVAHATGAGAGLLIGALIARTRLPERTPEVLQPLLGLGVFFLMALAWTAALAR